MDAVKRFALPVIAFPLALTDFFILKPSDLSKGNHKVFFEAPNRNGKLFGGFNGSGGGNNPGASAADAATTGAAYPGFLMNRGYSMIWIGWDQEPFAPGATNTMRVTGPVAKNADGSVVTCPAYEYIVFDNTSSTSFTTYYDTNATSTAQAKLTRRQFITDSPVVLADNAWSWTSANSMRCPAMRRSSVAGSTT